MSKVSLSIAISDYDHVRDLVEGRVPVEGIELVPINLPVEEIFYRFISNREWDISEMSFAKYAAMTAAGTADFTAIPVFPSRMFRQSSIYVRADSDLRDAAQLKGKRIGLPEWAQSAAVYSRGWLMETLGIPLAEIEWFQAGVNQAGRKEKVTLNLPEGVQCTAVPQSSLTEMLLDGRLDAVFSAHPPAPFEAGTGEIRHLIPDVRAVERDYFEQTGIFPIMHVIAIRNAALERNPWIAQNLYKAFCAARAASLHRMFELTASRFPLPWASSLAEDAKALFGELFPYGVEANRTTLEAFLRFAHAQGVTSRQLAVEELFAASTLSEFRI
jgi:4,5-dihydroxyphthalate decarboxylase